MAFAFAYRFLGEVQSEPFFGAQGDGNIADDLFFSFVTLTTTGYGNLVPAGNPGQSIAVLEALHRPALPRHRGRQAGHRVEAQGVGRPALAGGGVRWPPSRCTRMSPSSRRCSAPGPATAQAEYPTIDDFAYHEEVTFGHVGKPFLAYAQRTRAADDGRPLHAEHGYFRAPSPGRIELALAHPSGITEIAAGTVVGDGTTLVVELATITVARTPTAKEVTTVERSIRVDGDASPTRCAWPPSANRCSTTWRRCCSGRPDRRATADLGAHVLIAASGRGRSHIRERARPDGWRIA